MWGAFETMCLLRYDECCKDKFLFDWGKTDDIDCIYELGCYCMWCCNYYCIITWFWFIKTRGYGSTLCAMILINLVGLTNRLLFASAALGSSLISGFELPALLVLFLINMLLWLWPAMMAFDELSFATLLRFFWEMLWSVSLFLSDDVSLKWLVDVLISVLIIGRFMLGSRYLLTFLTWVSKSVTSGNWLSLVRVPSSISISSVLPVTEFGTVSPRCYIENLLLEVELSSFGLLFIMTAFIFLYSLFQLNKITWLNSSKNN